MPAVLLRPQHAKTAYIGTAGVRSVTVRAARAEVVIETDQSKSEHLNYVYCVQGNSGRWREVVSGNGPTVRWGNPGEYAWSY